MHDVSLVFRTCVPNTLSRISSRFQLLSRLQRQVAHALLTRPPLSYSHASRRIYLNSPVRLECVRHAASVHPEPGSNSLKFLICSPKFPPALQIFFRDQSLLKLSLALFASYLVSSFPQRISLGFSTLLLSFVFLSLLNFQLPIFPAARLRNRIYFTRSQPHCQQGFEIFFPLLRLFFLRFSGELFHSTTPLSPCQYLFLLFLIFFILKE